MAHRFNLAPPLALLLLAGCVSASGEEPTRTPGRTPIVPAGLGAVMGQTARELGAALGEADLDVREGRARKLQYSGPACVLDAYLYPRGAGDEPVVTWIDTRMPDGRDIDRASCVAALTLRR